MSESTRSAGATQAPAQYENVPIELKSQPIWVGWHREPQGDGGKLTKVLYQARMTRAKASSTDPATWAGFDAVLSAEARDSVWIQGIGMVFKPGSGMVGIDLDNSLHPDRSVKPWARPWVEAILPSYAEVSPSGTGLKFWTAGEKPGTRCTKRGLGPDGDGAIEIYDSGRFFTVTGDIFPGAVSKLLDRTKAVAAIYREVWPEPQKAAGEAPRAPGNASGLSDDEILNRARGSAKGAIFARLFDDGDLTIHKDHSSADLALVGSLAFWTGGDPEIIDRLFRRSKLMRPKWDERRGEKTYGEMTIVKALEGRTEFYSGGQTLDEPGDFKVVSLKLHTAKGGSGGNGKAHGTGSEHSEDADGFSGKTGTDDLRYTEDGGRWYIPTPRKDGPPVLVEISNFTAKIQAVTIIDDGTERTQRWVIEGVHCDGEVLGPADVRAEDFNAMEWVAPQFGHMAIMAPGRGMRDHVRTAIQDVSRNAPCRTVYAHTGWRQVSGGWGYLSGSGLISSTGLDPSVSVDLGPSLKGYSLPEPPEDEALKLAISSTFRLLDFGQPTRKGSLGIAAVVLALPIRAAMMTSDFSVQYTGPSGAFKSSVAALSQQFFGPAMNSRALPANWDSTSNSIGGTLHIVKDALLTVDDFVPGGSSHDQDRAHREAERIFRAQGNGAARGRMKADGSMRPAKPPRGTVLSTGEDRVRRKSANARTLSLWFAKGSTIDLTTLTMCQADADAGLYAGAMAGFIRWLAPQYEARRAELLARVLELRSEATAIGDHARTPEILANLGAGFETYLDFAIAVGAITEEVADGYAARVWDALKDASAAMRADNDHDDHGGRFLTLVSSALSSGQAHVAEPLAGLWPEGYEAAAGWTQELAASPPAWRATSPRIGWADVNSGIVYLDPDATMKAANRVAVGAGEPLNVTEQTILKTLDDAGKLAAKSPGRLKLKKKCEGVARYTVAVRFADLWPQDCPDT